MSLYYIASNDDDGNNFDLVVRANSPTEAFRLWQNHFDFDDGFEPESIRELPPPDGPVRAIPWEELPPFVSW